MTLMNQIFSLFLKSLDQFYQQEKKNKSDYIEYIIIILKIAQCH